MGFFVALFLALLSLLGVPQCAMEDGSTQSMCVWHGDNGVTVINLDYGKAWFTMGGE